jgi:hypothetical protein
VPGAAAHLEDAVVRARIEEAEDHLDASRLDEADERARVVVKPVEVVLDDHRVVPGLDLASVAETRRGRHFLLL